MFDLRKHINSIKDNIKSPSIGIPTGIDELDNLILGLSPCEMITIAGRPGMGKSSFARNILLSTGKPELNKGVSVLFSLEMSKDSIAELLVANMGQLHYQRIQRDGATEEEGRIIDNVCDTLAHYNIIIIDDTFVTPLSMKATLQEIAKEEKIACIIVDYLQLMQLPERTDNRQEEVARISRSLSSIAMEFKVPLVAFSQLNRNVEYRESSRPRMADLRESGSIENDSSKIVLIHRPSYYTLLQDPNAEDSGEVELIICKNRRGAGGIVKCAWLKEYMSFMNIPNEEF